MRGRRILEAMALGARKARATARLASCYHGDNSTMLMIYGMGAPERLEITANHVKKGGRVIGWDAGYWDRTLPHNERRYRITIDALHPPQFVMLGKRPSAIRWKRSGLEITQAGDPNGPIILAGNGPKSTAIGAAGWTARKAREIREAFPGRKLLYRPKPKRGIERDVDHDGISLGRIEAALDTASLVVCRHSNVAVDSCRMGVPVVCDDGAAAAIYPSELSKVSEQPEPGLREEFLHRLAWWQWSLNECASGEVWRWLRSILDEIGERSNT